MEQTAYDKLYNAMSKIVIEHLTDVVATHICSLVNAPTQPGEHQHVYYEYQVHASKLIEALTAMLRAFPAVKATHALNFDASEYGTLEFGVGCLAETMWFEPMDKKGWVELVQATAQILNDSIASWI